MRREHPRWGRCGWRMSCAARFVRWEREEPMALWQLDNVGGAFLADGTEAKIVTGR